MKTKRILISILCFILILTVTIIPTVLTVGASTSDYDYSKPGSNNKIFTSADLLEYIGIELSEGERAYLLEYGTFKLSFECVTNQQITVVNTENTTQITARPYSYTAANGKEVTWIPTAVSVEGVSGDFTSENDLYVATFDSTSLNEDATVDVTYELGGIPSIPASLINELLNLAYFKSLDIKEQFGSYETAKNAYDTYFSENRDAIEKYYSDTEKYSQYVRDKLIYDEKKEVYDAYLDALEKYKQDYAKYEQYKLELDNYNAIIENNENYENDLAKYNDYCSKMTTIREQIAVLDDGLFEKATYLNRQLYSSLFSGLVDQIIAENTLKQLYINVLGIDKQVIDDCEDASDDIRAILEPKDGKHYKNLKTEEEKYEFYINNRDELRDAIIMLTRSLYELYSHDNLREMMHMAPTVPGINKPDYTEKLSIFISQLILFSNALSDERLLAYDGKTFLDKNATFSYWNEAGKEIKNRKAIDVLEGNEYIKDIKNAAPIEGGYPTEVEEPQILPVPDEPEFVSRPNEPEYVEEPTAPDVVSEPTPPAGMPNEPQKPKEYDNQLYKQLLSELNLGLLAERAEVIEDVSYTPSIILPKSIYSTDAVTVTFTDGKGGVVSKISVDKGSAVNFTGELPTKEDDFSASYTFSAWEDANGNIFDLSKVDEDVTLYPVFTPNYRKYDIENYTANGTNKKRINVSATDIVLDRLPITAFAELVNEDPAGLSVTASNVKLEISYSVLTELDRLGVSYIDINLDMPSVGEYTYELVAMNSNDEPVDVSARVSVIIPFADEAFAEKAHLTYSDGEKIMYASKNYSNGAISYTAVTGRSYSLTVRYLISVNSNVKDIVSVLDDSIPGQPVALTLDIPLGMELDLFYAFDSDPKTKYAIEGLSFIMPYDNIHIGGRLTAIEYTVIFESNGKQISNKTYKYGDTVRIPNNPTKLSDGEYSYKFIGWSPEVATVTADATYVAQFESIPLPAVEEKFPWFTVIYYTAITLFALGIAAIVIFILNKKGVISVKGILLFIKRKLSRVGGNEQSTETAISSEHDDFKATDDNTESENSALSSENDDSVEKVDNTESEKETDGQGT